VLASCAWFSLLLAASPVAPVALVPSPDEAWRIELYARALAPGEPVRVLVRSDGGVTDLTLTFLSRPVALAADPDARRLTGWTAVPLDAPSGPGALEVGWTIAGQPHRHSATVKIEARDFPEQRLKVESRYVAPPPDVTRRIEEERRLLEALWARRERPTTAPRPFVRPVPGPPTGTFGARRIFNGEPRAPHPGLDLRASVGTPVHAAGAGRVALAQDLYWTGGTVVLEHGEGLFTVYAHLSSVGVQEGDVVPAGAPLGRSGATGRVTGPHLHWGAKIGDVPVDPRALLDLRLFP